MKILLTGGAGFIGSHLSEALLGEGHELILVDNFNDYYPPEIKERNLSAIIDHPRLELVRGDIRDRDLVEKLHSRGRFGAVIHLAARAGVRPSLENPVLYQEVNVEGTLNLLEAARRRPPGRFIFASSSSVYGSNPRQPWKESDSDLRPESPYGATKVIGEHLCRIYQRTYNLKMAVMRLFTVYGPRQRPDMAIHKFTRLISRGRRIPVFGDGTSRRDYTYVADIVSGFLGALRRDFEFEIFNLGGGHSITLNGLIAKLEEHLGRKADFEKLPVQAGDAASTWADVSKGRKLLGYRPRFTLEEGLEKFIAWFKAEGDNE